MFWYNKSTEGKDMRFWRILCLLLAPSITALASGNVAVIKVNSAIGPATADYIACAISVATAQQDGCLIVELATPAGLLESTTQIVQILYGSAVPTVIFVTPSGANAASAGCFITLAADVAAM